jgi:hypothetical protein
MAIIGWRSRPAGQEFLAADLDGRARGWCVFGLPSEVRRRIAHDALRDGRQRHGAWVTPTPLLIVDVAHHGRPEAGYATPSCTWLRPVRKANRCPAKSNLATEDPPSVILRRTTALGVPERGIACDAERANGFGSRISGREGASRDGQTGKWPRASAAKRFLCRRSHGSRADTTYLQISALRCDPQGRTTRRPPTRRHVAHAVCYARMTARSFRAPWSGLAGGR